MRARWGEPGPPPAAGTAAAALAAAAVTAAAAVAAAAAGEGEVEGAEPVSATYTVQTLAPPSAVTSEPAGLERRSRMISPRGPNPNLNPNTSPRRARGGAGVGGYEVGGYTKGGYANGSYANGGYADGSHAEFGGYTYVGDYQYR